MKIVHLNTEPEPKQKRVPLHKDRAFVAQLRREFIEDHNRKFDNKQAQK